MKTNKKYALIINEALRSALDYDTPEEQINEFIRFFGNILVQTESIYLKMIWKKVLRIIAMNGVLMV